MSSNSRGFTLIEVVISIFILTVGLLGLMASANLAINMNTRDTMRDEAVRLGERWMSGSKNLPYANISSYTAPGHVVANAVNGVNVNYTINRTVQPLPNSTQISIVVRWNYKGQDFFHGVTSVATP